MIKVIATDMDGTLLGSDHKISKKTIEAIQKAQAQGIRFMVVTGRNYVSAMEALKGTNLVCDYILSSGAEIRNPDKGVVQSIIMTYEECEYLYNQLKHYPIGIMFIAEEENYMIGTKEEVDNGILDYIKYFHDTSDKEELRKTDLYRIMWIKTRVFPDFSEMKKEGANLSKMFLVSDDVDMLAEIKAELEKNKQLAVSSSFIHNLEVTDVRAQKGPVLKEYAASLGYSMDEIMVLGDSLNDMSMIEMDFGATIAMENADEIVKQTAKYITKSNAEDGVAYVIEEMLKKYDVINESESTYPHD